MSLTLDICQDEGRSHLAIAWMSQSAVANQRTSIRDRASIVHSMRGNLAGTSFVAEVNFESRPTQLLTTTWPLRLKYG
jgi:hypothetical protein